MPFDDYQKGMIQNFLRNQQWAKPQQEYKTLLQPNQEQAFRQWAQQNQQRLGAYSPDEPFSDYDYRGYWLKNKGQAPDGHFPDTFKTPYHETFSNESQYALPHAPAWEQSGKNWTLKDNLGNIIKQETE